MSPEGDIINYQLRIFLQNESSTAENWQNKRCNLFAGMEREIVNCSRDIRETLEAKEKRKVKHEIIEILQKWNFCHLQQKSERKKT